jgi:hypothetical protein
MTEPEGEAVPLGLAEHTDRARRAAVAAAILEGHRMVPQSGEELRRAEEGLRALVAEEPW